ncbi:hypothetical protein G9P44_003382 [Scheffersomyces stipitis]|nr:hypothetical protein G9P44_003382 [Scheffersomyces stipitis]
MTLRKHWKYSEDEDLVLSSLKGLVHSNPAVRLIPSEKVVFNPNSDTSKKITLISGGGAGHEPLHGGYVGDNLLDAAVSGHIFASPSTKQIMAAIRTKSHKEKGTIIVVKNYTGDILHFGLVAERAKNEGYNVELVIVADDVAVGKAQNKMVGRRGLAGTAIVHKILGAAVHSENAELKNIAHLGNTINDNLVTISASLDRTSVPGRQMNTSEFTGEDEAEVGLGIHNEPGVKISPIPNIDDLIEDLFHKLLSPDDKDRHYVDFDLHNDDYILLINNIGGTSSLELHLIAEHIVIQLPTKNRPKRILISDFVTSLNSPGFSITLLNLSNIAKAKVGFSTDQLLEFLDAPTDAPGWKPKRYTSKQWEADSVYSESPMTETSHISSSLKTNAVVFEKALVNAMNNLLKNEPDITRYDTIVGDGDCGETLAAGANAILFELKKKGNFHKNLSDPVATLAAITDLVEDSMGGTSGGLYSIYLTKLVGSLGEKKELTTQTFGDAAYSALYDGLFKYTRARVGGRTLVDTLQPFVDTLKGTGDIKASLSAAKKGCENTRELHAKFGRASYVDESEFKTEEGGVPDPGAVGLYAIIEGFVGAL